MTGQAGVMDTGGSCVRKIESPKVKGGQEDRGRIALCGSGHKTRHHK